MKMVLQFLGGFLLVAVAAFGVVYPGTQVWVERVVAPAYGLASDAAPATSGGLMVPAGWECAQMNEEYILCRPIRGGTGEAESAAPPSDPGL